MSDKKNTFTIEIDKPDGGIFSFEINPIDITVYSAMMSLIKKNRAFDAYIMALNTLKVDGSDDPEQLRAPEYINCLMALDEVFADMLAPAGTRVKKN